MTLVTRFASLSAIVGVLALLTAACSPESGESAAPKEEAVTPPAPTEPEARMTNIGDQPEAPDSPDQDRAAPSQTSGPRVSLPGGLTLFPPTGWTSQPAGGNRTVLLAPDGQTVVIASLDEGVMQQAVSELAGTIDLGDGVVLDPVDTPTLKGQIHSNRFTVRGAQSPTLGFVMIRDAGGKTSLSLIGLAPSADASQLQTTMNQLITRAEIGAPRPQATSEWQKQLKGRYLVRFYSGNGYSEKHEMWLCSDGSFAKRVDGGGFTTGVASGAFAGGLTGTWNAQGDAAGQGLLVLSSSDGQVLQYTLRQAPDGVLIDGQKWMRGENTACS